jgi:hypothetical protein
MGRRTLYYAGLLFVSLAGSWAQTGRSFVGTITDFKPEALVVEVKPDSGDAVPVTFTTETLVQRIAAGSKDLKSATAIKITDVAKGDRVLVTLAPGGNQARRIVIMSATDIAQRNEADTQDWMKRGIAGIVASKSGSQVVLKTRSLQGETQLTVTVNEQTKYRRYAPDSVRFVDASKSSLAEVSAGDQLRARGKKSEDGLKVDAEEVVFGTFLTKAGTVTAVNVEGKQVVVKDLVTSKPLTIHVTADSQLKAVPDFAAMMAARGGAGAGPGGPGAGPGAGGPGRPGGNGPGGPGGPGMMAGGRPGFDLAQMLERMPPTKLDNLKPGQTVIVSSTKGASQDEVTAITLLSNADFLIQMASRQPGRPAGSRPDMMNMPSGGMGGGLTGGLDGLGMPGMIP